MRTMWIVALLATAACIEGVDPNECGVDASCGSGRVCSAMGRCASVDEVRDIEVRWMIDGATPTLAMPGRCAETTAFRIGASGLEGGFITQASCEAGVGQLVHVPREFTEVAAAAYRSIGNGGSSVLGEASIGIPAVGDIVTLDLRFQ